MKIKTHKQQIDKRVAVLRCRNCQHHARFLPWCYKHDAFFRDDDYCSRGKRA